MTQESLTQGHTDQLNQQFYRAFSGCVCNRSAVCVCYYVCDLSPRWFSFWFKVKFTVIGRKNSQEENILGHRAAESYCVSNDGYMRNTKAIENI